MKSHIDEWRLLLRFVAYLSCVANFHWEKRQQKTVPAEECTDIELERAKGFGVISDAPPSLGKDGLLTDLGNEEKVTAAAG